ncbi:MAG: hypothetical protein EOR26_04895 [Mesorhizobium sp.]|uniref:BNR-4 repeat-containing protein n=1 Tax=unclassified Mesorhizobium TaxID=325217 RepID=UPI000FCA496A|nr:MULTISPECIES: BNR-4 repeat-containing protein [unclassified Mesorhizobium]RUV70662.1 hypothetical protein EOA78_19710 [Mesorhizobium sp. M5C.F.Cr.IN.023.01.1.1]RWI51038.1 MAG: hypothetical protein EOR15_06475 [Mesorhizobium sp.]RWI62026.1 MAG: hypothetical protein EOR16_03675 [Mesorhizobium sp.]RWJ13875.1 MAG: hypothetical protein EOR24_00925 [Mesorhizobium sp.]RWJ16898.1 MAG: hypothetical protein EOR25_13510 [Mesorhizobium sp.]
MSILPFINREAPEALDDVFFSNEGHTSAWYTSTQYNALYDAVSNKTFVAYETVFLGSVRLSRVRAYNHATNQWGRSYNVGPRSLVSDDDHGVPGLAMNADGRLVISWGNHNGDFYTAISTNPRDETAWTAGPVLVGAYTYPHLVLMPDNSMVCLLRKQYNNGEGGFTIDNNGVLVYRILTFVGAVITAGAEVYVGDLGNDSRWYQSTAILGGDGLIHQACSRANAFDTERMHVYYYKIDIPNLRLVSFGGVNAPFPVTLTDMNTSFRIYTTGAGNTSNTPAFCFDAAGRSHIATHEGFRDPGGDPYFPYDVKHMVGAAGVFAPAVTVGVTECRFNAEGLVPIAGGGVSLMWPKNRTGVDQRGGDIVCRNLLAGGASADFGAETTLMEQGPGRAGMDSTVAAKDGHANLRALWYERAPNALRSSAFDQRCYAWGDRGMRPGRVRSFVVPKALTGDGFCIDLSDTASIFSDAGITRAVAGNIVKQVNDKFGTGNILSNAAVTGPFLDKVGNQYGLKFDMAGGGSRYLTGASKAWAAGGFMTTAVFRPYSTVDASRSVLSLDQGAGNPRVATPININGQTPRAIAFHLTTQTTLTGGLTDTLYGQDYVVQAYTIGTTLFLYVNGVLVASGPITGGAVNATAVLMRLGASAAAVPASFFNGLLTGLIHRVGEQTTQMRDDDYAWALAQMPS